METVQTTRRSLLAAALTWIVALPALARAQAAPPAKELPHLDEKHKLAVATAYHADASKVDAAKYSVYKAGQLCSNCEQIQGKDGEPVASLQDLPGQERGGGRLVQGLDQETREQVTAAGHPAGGPARCPRYPARAGAARAGEPSTFALVDDRDRATSEGEARGGGRLHARSPEPAA